MVNGLADLQLSGYQPLDPDGREIRVIQIIPIAPRNECREYSDINCVTEIVTFGGSNRASVPYKALSYTWGDPQNLVTISLDDQAIHVTENLAVALRHLANSNSGVRLWIDAICIDQSNEVEKSKQVAIMGTIFKRASEVIVWIGPQEDGSAEAIHVLKQIGEACQSGLQISSGETFSPAITQNTNTQDKDDSSLLQSIGCKWFPQGVPAFNPAFITRIFQRPWFRRVWVLQEAAVNTNVVFHCGDACISKSTLWVGGRAIIALTNNVFDYTKSWIADGPLWQTLSGANFISRRTMDLVRSDDGQYTLGQLLLETSANLGEWSYEASDPRDRVYAIMGLSSDLPSLGINSDYEKPCKDVYTSAAEVILASSGTIDILYVVSRPKNVRYMPSWVPDWSTSIPASFGLRQLGRFHASGKDSSAKPTFSSDRYGNRILTLHGYRVDTVKTSLRRGQYPSRKSCSDCETAVRDVVDLFQELSRIETAAYPTSESRSEALWRTPIADCDAVFNIQRKYRPPATVRMKESYNTLMSLSSKDSCRDLRARAYLHVMKLVSARRRLFVSQRGYLGLGADTIRRGDVICLLFGGDSPLILRDTRSGYYKLVGEAYIHGIMHGELLSTAASIAEEFRLC